MFVRSMKGCFKEQRKSDICFCDAMGGSNMLESCRHLVGITMNFHQDNQWFYNRLTLFHADKCVPALLSLLCFKVIVNGLTLTSFVFQRN